MFPEFFSLQAWLVEFLCLFQICGYCALNSNDQFGMRIIDFFLDFFHFIWKLVFGHENSKYSLKLYLKNTQNFDSLSPYFSLSNFNLPIYFYEKWPICISPFYNSIYFSLRQGVACSTINYPIFLTSWGKIFDTLQELISLKKTNEL